MPVNFTSNDHSIASTAFSVDFDQTCLAFDATDSDQDGIPDAVTLSLPGAFNVSVTFDGGDTDGELDFFIADLLPPPGLRVRRDDCLHDAECGQPAQRNGGGGQLLARPGGFVWQYVG